MFVIPEPSDSDKSSHWLACVYQLFAMINHAICEVVAMVVARTSRSFHLALDLIRVGSQDI